MPQESAKRTSDAAAEKGTGNASGESTSPRQAAEEVVREAGAKANEVKERVAEETTRTRDELQETASGFFSDFREAVADQVGRLAEALRGTGQQMHEQELDQIGAYPEQLADGIDQVSSYLRDTSGPEMRRDFERAVASNPTMVVGGLALIGAATAMYLKREKSGEIRQRVGEMRHEVRERVDEMGRKGKQALADAAENAGQGSGRQEQSGGKAEREGSASGKRESSDKHDAASKGSGSSTSGGSSGSGSSGSDKSQGGRRGGG